MRRFTVALILVVTILTLFCSCQGSGNSTEPKDANDLWSRIDNAMNALNSYTSTTSSAITIVNSEGVYFEGTTSGETRVVGVNDGDLYVYQLSSTDLNAASIEYTESNSHLIVYQQGCMYLYNKQYNSDFRDSKSLCSKLSKDEFMEYYSDFEMNITPVGCSKVAFAKEDNGDWSLDFSGFSQDDIEKISGKLGFYYSNFGIAMSDIKVSVIADAEYRLTEMKIELISNHNLTVFSAVINCSDFDTTEIKEFDKRSYIEVDDVRVVNAIVDDMNVALNQQYGGFVYSTSQKFRNKEGDESTIFEETDVVTYEMTDSGFIYDVAAIALDSNIIINYANGVQTIYVNETKEETKKQKESEAIAFVATLMNGGGYFPTSVTDVKIVGDNVFEITCSMKDTSNFKRFIEGNNDFYTGYTLSYLATFNDEGELVTLESNLVISGKKCAYTITSKLELD